MHFLIKLKKKKKKKKKTVNSQVRCLDSLDGHAV